MKNITSIEIPANILSALASNPGDPRLAMEVCSALVKAYRCRARSIVDLRVRSLGFLKGADGYAVP